MGEALELARDEGVNSVAFGDLFLEDVRRYREEMLGSAGMTGVFPLWGRDTTKLADYFISNGYRAILSCVDTSQIPAELAGRAYDPDLLAELPASADPCGENGEFHTFVYDGPIFSRPVESRRGRVILRENRFMYCDLLDGPVESPEHV
jgi:diphthamide synthase (EF-2-diphthine--ammonia ligase)